MNQMVPLSVAHITSGSVKVTRPSLVMRRPGGDLTKTRQSVSDTLMNLSSHFRDFRSVQELFLSGFLYAVRAGYLCDSAVEFR